MGLEEHLGDDQICRLQRDAKGRYMIPEDVCYIMILNGLAQRHTEYIQALTLIEKFRHDRRFYKLHYWFNSEANKVGYDKLEALD